MAETTPGAAPTYCGIVGPKWTRGELERPLGEKDMGGWTAAVYTNEQQARLGIDEHGEAREALTPAVSAITTAPAGEDASPSPSVPLSSVGAQDDEIVE